MTQYSEKALRVLRETFGHAAFRPGQAEIVAALESGVDAIAVLPTGSGKSICYQVPALLEDRPTLIVSPLLALMRDQVQALRSTGVRAVAITSESTDEERMLGRRYLAARQAGLVYASPERLSSSQFRALVSPGYLSRIVVDEAHCISEWGHDFRPAYRQIADFAVAAGSPPVAAFTATATPETRADIKHQLRLRKPGEFIGSVDRPNLHWAVRQSRSLPEGFEYLRVALGRQTRGATIVYVATRAQTVAVAAAVRRCGHGAEAYHAGLSTERRREVQESFMSQGRSVIVATCAFGMGIDHPHVRLVCHLGAPGALESYVQEAGRAGRDGDPARCLLVTTTADRHLQRARLRGLAGSARQRARRRLRGMNAYVRETVCRRAAVSAYFGEGVPECRGCDLCEARRSAGNRKRPPCVNRVSGIQ